MIAILGLVTAGLSAVSSLLSIAKLVKNWNKPAGYLIRFINFIGSIVDWFIAKVTAVELWVEETKIRVGIKKVEIQVEKKRRRGTRKHHSRWGRWKDKL